MENNVWSKAMGSKQPVADGILIDVILRSGKHLTKERADYLTWGDFDLSSDIMEWRLHKPEQTTLDDAIAATTFGVDAFQYPQTSFKPSSEAQLRSDEAARVSSLLSEKLSIISDIASKLTRKNFSVADIKLVKDLLESVEEYEENK